MNIQREEFLARLRLVQPGLMTKGIIEQGNCFVFKDGWVYTFNEQICCRTKVDVDFSGAVVATSFLNLLEVLDDDSLDMFVKDGTVRLMGKNKGAKYALQKKIKLNLELVQEPTSWKRLPDNFTDALALVQECTAVKKTNYALTCVHIHPKWIEATDRFQIARYTVDMPLKESVLVPKDNIKCIVQIEPYSMAVSPTWTHFRTKDKQTIVSCLSSKESFKDYTEFINSAGGENITLPKGLEEAAQRASKLSEESPNNKLLLEIDKERIRVRGIGITGEYYEDEKVEYDGKPMKFQISPKLLMELTQRHSECKLSDKLKVELGAFTWICGLGKVQSDKE